MIRQITGRIQLTIPEQNSLNAIKPHSKKQWDKPPNDEIKAIKASIRNQLITLQDYICAYCGLKLGGTSAGQTEHIAPKYAYENYTFELENLAMACDNCNGFGKKGKWKTVATLGTTYDQCVFKLVHPYYDNPDDHYSWAFDKFSSLITLKTEKAKYSDKVFKLSSPRMTELRGEQVIIARVKGQTALPPETEALLQKAIEHKPS